MSSNNEITLSLEKGKIKASIPREKDAVKVLQTPLLIIGGISLTLEVVPPNTSRVTNDRLYVKVLSGVIYWNDAGVEQVRRALVPTLASASMAIKSNDNHFRTKEEGAVLFVCNLVSDKIPAFSDMAQVTVDNIYPEGTVGHTHTYKWTKVEDLDWAKVPPFPWNGAEFYNMEGVSVGYADGQHLCYIQFWTAGKGVDARLHNHATDDFAEVHACLVNGTGGGMETMGDDISTPPDLDNVDPSKLTKVPVPTFYEHGPLWQTPSREGPPADKVTYPFHKWQAAHDHKPGQLYDLWAAFEFFIPHATLTQREVERQIRA